MSAYWYALHCWVCHALRALLVYLRIATTTPHDARRSSKGNGPPPPARGGTLGGERAVGRRTCPRPWLNPDSDSAVGNPAAEYLPRENPRELWEPPWAGTTATTYPRPHRFRAPTRRGPTRHCSDTSAHVATLSWRCASDCLPAQPGLSRAGQNGTSALPLGWASAHVARTPRHGCSLPRFARYA